MEAVRRVALCAGSLVLFAAISCGASELHAANARSENFLVSAPTPRLAQSVAKQAERFRDELAVYWLGKPLPRWNTPCPIKVIAGPQLAAQGVTTYNRAPVGNFQMKVIGSEQRILDSVLPHEVTHTVLATHFGKPLPRWADEGICTTVEHAEERRKHEAKLREFLSTRRGIAMNRLFLLTEYPNDMLPMYAQGYSVCRFLIEQSGPRKFIAFLTDYMQQPSWTENVRKHYGYDSLAGLQEQWLAWVANGSGPVDAYVSTKSGPKNSGAKNALASNRRQAGSLELNGPSSAAPLGSRPGARGTATAAAAQVASTGSRDTGSWYKRRREQTAVGRLASGAERPVEAGAGSTPRNAASATPPSVARSGTYSVSQPQPEQRYGQSTPMASSLQGPQRYR
jgi:hypothetical protein